MEKLIANYLTELEALKARNQYLVKKINFDFLGLYFFHFKLHKLFKLFISNMKIFFKSRNNIY